MQPVFCIVNISMMSSDTRGFTLIELLVTLVVAGVMVLGITQIYAVVGATQRENNFLEAATRAGQTEVESLRNQNYVNLTAGSTIDFTSQLPSTLPTPRTGTVAVSSPEDGVKRVDVTITYTDGGHAHTVQLSSLIGALGIGK